MSEFQNTFLKSVGGQARLQESSKVSPWGKFLATLDSNPKISETEAKDLFAKTLSQASSDWKDPNDNTLLMHMASRGQTGIVKRLIHELYADVNATNKGGMTALHMAARGGFMGVCTELLDSHADPCKKDQNGSTPAMIARDKGYTEVATLLSKKETEKRVWKAGFQSLGQQK